MRTITILLVSIITLTACGGGEPEYNEADTVTAETVLDSYSGLDSVCDYVWIYEQEELKDELERAYNAGKPDGEIWQEADISPTIEEVRALVDVTYDYCRN